MKKLYFCLSFIIFTSITLFSQITFTDVAVTMGVNDPGAGQGAVMLDVNNDGYLDIFLDNNNNANKLWINSSGTAFTDQTTVYGLSFTGPGRGVSAGDFDNDGNIDIMIGQFNATLILYKNNAGSFTNYTSTAGIALTSWGGSVNWFDYNNDGRLDAMLGNDGVPYHYNYLFRNDNLLSFTNVAYSSGITDSTSTLTIATADYDNDGDLDIFCGTQTNYGPATSFLYKNNGNGTFSDVTVASGMIIMEYSWGSDWGDFDNDGDMDLYAANSNGPNRLLQNNGNGTFTDVSSQYGVADPSQSFSCGWADFDNDTDLDLYVANGSTGIDKLFRNDGSTFTDVAATVGTNDTRHSACISWGDFNNDGFMDLYLVNNGTENRLYKNNAGNSNKWVILKLRGVVSNRSAIGTRVRVKTGGISQIREVQGGSGGKGQNSLPVEFGLGSAGTIDSLIVRWPSGTVQTFTNVNPNVIYSLTEGSILLGLNQTSSEIPQKYTLKQNYPNPFNPTTTIKFEIPNTKSETNSKTEIRIYDALGREVTTLINEQLQPGSYEVTFDAGNLPSGVYFYMLRAGGFVDAKKMILVK